MSKIAKIIWQKEDLLSALASQGFAPIQESHDILVSARIKEKIEEASTATRWEIIGDAIRMTEGLVKA